MEVQKYQPISCDFYDELELLAMRQQEADLLLHDGHGSEERIRSVIKNLYTRNKEEFMLLRDGSEIRLDRIISVNGKAMKNYC